LVARDLSRCVHKSRRSPLLRRAHVATPARRAALVLAQGVSPGLSMQKLLRAGFSRRHSLAEGVSPTLPPFRFANPFVRIRTVRSINLKSEIAPASLRVFGGRIRPSLG
jgi:hypothetical protein